MNSSGSRQADPLRMPIVKLEFKIVFSSRAVCPYHSDGWVTSFLCLATNCELGMNQKKSFVFSDSTHWAASSAIYKMGLNHFLRSIYSPVFSFARYLIFSIHWVHRYNGQIPNSECSHLFLYKSELDTFQDFLIKLDIKPLIHLLEISIFSLNNVILRLTKIMNRADKNRAHF